MPDLTVKALAELIHLPMYEHLRILAEQKYPAEIPAVFRVPFYGPAQNAVRAYYRSDHNLTVIDLAASDRERVARGLSLESGLGDHRRAESP